MSRQTLVGLILLILTVAVIGVLPARAQEAGIQPTELQPPDGEIPVLYPPDPPYAGEVTVVILTDDVSVAWHQLRGITSEVGGSVATSTSGLGNVEGVRYEYAIAVIEIPEFRFDEFVSMMGDVGRFVAYEYSSLAPPGSVIVDVTLTDSVEPFAPVPDGDSRGRVDRALDTAGDVLLTMLSVAIVAGAVLFPIAIMAAVAYAVWRWTRRRWPIVEPSMEQPEQPQEELVES